MQIHSYFKWLAVICVGVFVSGCVAQQPLNGGVVYSEPAQVYYESPQSIDYYDEVYVYEDPFYRAPYLIHGPLFSRHLHDLKHHHYYGGKHPAHLHNEKRKERTKSEKKSKKADRKADRKAKRRAAREAECRNEGFANCRAKKRAERKAEKEPASKKVDSSNNDKENRRAARLAQCRAEGFRNCRAKKRAEKKAFDVPKVAAKRRAKHRKRLSDLK